MECCGWSVDGGIWKVECCRWLRWSDDRQVPYRSHIGTPPHSSHLHYRRIVRNCTGLNFISCTEVYLNVQDTAVHLLISIPFLSNLLNEKDKKMGSSSPLSVYMWIIGLDTSDPIDVTRFCLVMHLYQFSQLNK